MPNPNRVVSLVPSHTESLLALGLGKQIVGRTRFCVHPAAEVASIPHVGGTKDASFEKIMQLKPDLVVADKDENPRKLIEQLQANGVEAIWSEIDTVQDAADFLRIIGSKCGLDSAADSRAAEIEDLLATLERVEPLPIWCPIWYEPWMTFNGTAYPSSVLKVVGFHNVFEEHAGDKYFEVSEEEVANSAAEWTLLPTEPFPFHKQRENVDTTLLGPAGAKNRVRVIDGEALTWFGVRTVSGLRELAQFRGSLDN